MTWADAPNYKLALLAQFRKANYHTVEAELGLGCIHGIRRISL